MKSCLLDTGPIVALLDKSEPTHRSVLDTMTGLRAELHTTGAVITEAFYFLSETRGGPSRIADFIQAGEVQVHNVFTSEALQATSHLMGKYSTTPMDFADATLVWLAEQRDISAVLTLDRRGFSTFRFGRNRRFSLLIQEGSS